MEDSNINETLPSLTSVTLERFKAAFQPGRIQLRPFTVLIGKNGSGKSTLVEALQWIDSTLRRDAVEASKRYFGVHDLFNVRSRIKPPYFQLTLEWTHGDETLTYTVKVEESPDQRTPRIASETLSKNDTETLVAAPEADDRLALWRSTLAGTTMMREFWRRAVFLRLSPTRLAEGSLLRRSSWEPLLDEEGQNLPALLNELDDNQRRDLVESIQSVLADMTGVTVSQPAGSRNERVHYSLSEIMPNKGRAGSSTFAIPAWMLSEGTRRLTAIFALLSRRPQPSLLCIEEIENGLDPWAVVKVLNHLKSAVDNGVQVIVTTHSPWLLDHIELSSIIQVRRVQGVTQYTKFMDREEIKAFAEQVPAGTRYVQEP
jgi:predicted ATPase